MSGVKERARVKFGDTLRAVRERRGYSLRELSKRSGVSVTFIHQIEHGKSSPTMQTLENLAEGLAVPVTVLAFLASDTTQLQGVDAEVADKLGGLAWKLIGSGSEGAA